MNDGETIDELMRLSPEEILIRWVNYHLANSDANRANENVRIKNFSKDIENSIAYYYLIQQIAPGDIGIDISGKAVSIIFKFLRKFLQLYIFLWNFKGCKFGK